MTSLDFAALMREERQRRGAAAAVAQPPLFATRAALDLELHRVGAEAGLTDCFYVPDFLSSQEACDLQAAVLRADGAGAGGWVSLPGRRLLNLGGVPSASGMFREPLPPFAASLARSLTEAGMFEPNAEPDQFLINEYFEGQGIDAHRDGPLYQPKAAIVSLGSAALLNFYGPSCLAPGDVANRNEGDLVRDGQILRRVASVALEENSLLLFSGPAYTDLWHGISSGVEVEEPDELCVNATGLRLARPWRRGHRLSFTVRRAARVVERPATGEAAAEARRRQAHWLRSVSDGREQKERAKELPQRHVNLGQKLLFRGKGGTA